LDEVPEDTDIFLALNFRPAVTHFVVTKHFIYFLSPQGEVTAKMTLEAWKKIQQAH
jgi:hypothetical protein